MFENYPNAGQLTANTGVEIRDLNIFEQNNYPLAVLVVPGEQLELIFVYDASRFDDDAITRMQGSLVTLLESFIKTPRHKLREFSIVTDDERSKALDAWNDAPPNAQGDLCIHDLIERAAKENPDALAVVFEDQQITYRHSTTGRIVSLGACVRWAWGPRCASVSM